MNDSGGQLRPTSDSRDEWRAYWTTLGMHWRTEPEISEECQRFLTARMKLAPDIGRGVFPFKDVQLTRADIEWLLWRRASRSAQGDWQDPFQHAADGLDLRGADLGHADLSNLPLTKLHAGLTYEELEGRRPRMLMQRRFIWNMLTCGAHGWGDPVCAGRTWKGRHSGLPTWSVPV